MNRYFFACSLIVLSSNAWADQPPSWQPFSVKSENAKFVATVAPQDEEKPALPWESAYRIEVRSVEGDQPGPAVWSRRYAFSGYEGGLLSNDGAFFVYVDYWYRHSAAAVVIYSKAGSCYLTGEQLGLKERSLQKNGVASLVAKR